MEIVGLVKKEKTRCKNVTKHVPIITDEVMTSILFIHAHKRQLTLKPSSTDVIHYVIKGSGKITIGTETSVVTEGSLILVPKTKIHFYSTSEDRLVVLCVRSLNDNKEN